MNWLLLGLGLGLSVIAILGAYVLGLCLGSAYVVRQYEERLERLEATYQKVTHREGAA